MIEEQDSKFVLVGILKTLVTKSITSVKYDNMSATFVTPDRQYVYISAIIRDRNIN